MKRLILLLVITSTVLALTACKSNELPTNTASTTMSANESTGVYNDTEPSDSTGTTEEGTEVTVPNTSEPAALDTQATEPETTVPETTVPETTVPETTEPKNTEPENTQPSTQPTQPTQPPQTGCEHKNTKTVGEKAATCSAEGYTGDTVCAACGVTVSTGSAVSKTAHTETLVGEKAASCSAEGYTGDKVCAVCGVTVSTGSAVSKTAHTETVTGQKEATESQEGYTGDTVCAVCGTVIQKGETIPKKTPVDPTANITAIEKQILDEINAERAKAGLSPLEIDVQSLYKGAGIRADEYASWNLAGRPGGSDKAHVRPDGRSWTSIYEDVGFTGSWRTRGENCAIAPLNGLVSGWMGSTGHRENILRAGYQYIAISVKYIPEWNVYCAVTLFRG